MRWLAGLTPFLIAQSFKVTLILLIALAGVALARRRSAALRHWLLAAAFAAVSVMPLLALIVPSWTLGDVLPMPTPSMRAALAATAVADATDRETPALDTAALRLITTSDAFAPWRRLQVAPTQDESAHARALLTQRRVLAIMSAVTSIWILGVVVMLTRRVAGLARLATIARDARRIDTGAWRVMTDAIARELGVARPIALLHGHHDSLLVTWGFWRPRVLLPASAAFWSDRRLRIVLLHELAHVRRADWAIQMGAELLRCLCWINPLAWIACTRLRRESECACDDEVLARGIDRTDYASHVLDLARALAGPRLSSSVAATAMAHPSGLERRIRIMLTDSLNRTPLTRAARLGMVAALAMVTVPLAGFAAMRQAPAAMVGTLVDQNGGAIADAPVMLAPVTGGDARKVTTDAQGQFAFEGVTPGEYRFDVKAMGFAPLHERVTLAPDQRLERRLALTLGSVQETLVVRGANPMALARDHRDPPRDHTNGPLEPPTLLRNALPAYPARLHDAGVQGVVNLDGIIAVDGTVTAITADPQSNPELAAAVREAVLLWRFDPTRLRGVPVETHIRITINFEL